MKNENRKWKLEEFYNECAFRVDSKKYMSKISPTIGILCSRSCYLDIPEATEFALLWPFFSPIKNLWDKINIKQTPLQKGYD